ncbi:MAG TPA: lytic transglycosylase domain-containing protein [Scandinavium sp.]|jgi:soluble lytic murein transglycosylase-like protein
MILLLFWAMSSRAFCFDVAGAKYHVDPLLIEAIATGESNLHPAIEHVNRQPATGRFLSRDYGLMQINSSHLPGLIQAGVIHGARDLLDHPCLNVQVGTWILAQHFQICGVSWNCLGSYNAGFRQDRHETREAYANRIYSIYRRLLRQKRGLQV